MNNKLQGKDFINIGIFTAIYFVIIMAAGMLGVIPIFIPLLSVIVPLLGGIPMMLYFSKVKKFGMITIQGFLSGILMMIGGMGYWCVGTFLVAALICDLMLKADGYKNAKKSIVAYGIYAMSVIGAFIPIILTRDSYHEMLATEGFGVEYADTLMSYMPNWILPVLLVASFICGIIGGFIGQKMFKKHFERAGIV